MSLASHPRPPRFPSSATRGPLRTLALIALLLALAATLLPAHARAEEGAAAGASSPDEVDLDTMDESHRAELDALEAEHAQLVAGAQAASAARAAQIRGQLDAEVAAATASHDTAAAGRAAVLAARLGVVENDRLARRAELDAVYAARATELTTFIEAILDELGESPDRDAVRAAETQIKDEGDAVTEELEAERAVREAAVLAIADAEEAALEAEEDEVEATAEQQLAELEAAHEATELELETAIDQVEHDARVARSTLEAQEQAAREAAEDRSAIREARDDERRAARDRHDAELDAAEAAVERRLAALDAQMEENDQNLDEGQARVESTLEERLARIDAEMDRVHDTLRATRDADKDDFDARLDRIKLFYRTAERGLRDGQNRLREALEARLEDLDAERTSVAAAADREFVDRADALRSTAEHQDAVALRELADTVDAIEARFEISLAAEQDRLEHELDRIARNIERREQLLRAEYYTLRKRAVAFLNSGQFDSLDATFDPESDDGSLYNVVRRIDADDLDVAGAGVDVALIDTGVVDVEGLAEADVVIGPDFSFDESIEDLRGRDANGHGTHMAGIIVGRDQAWVEGDRERRPERFLGVAPDARLVSVKVGAADGAVDVTQVIAAINWIIANRRSDGLNIRVINLSFGTDSLQDSQIDPLSHAVERAWHAGIVVVVAGGNDGWSAERLTNPASNPWVIAVGAAQARDRDHNIPSGFSNGSESSRTVDLAAPGRSIASLRVPGSAVDEQSGTVLESRFIRGSGTSQAAAVVSGAVAVILSARPELTPDQVKQLITETADRRPTDDPVLVGAGYLDVDDALRESPDWQPQPWPISDGSGSVDAARGSVRVVMDDIVLEGEMDIFGRSWTGSRWSEDSWSGSRWSGAAWTGSRWSGSRWSSEMWTGSSWSGSRWSSDDWLGSRWSGSRWSEASWSGSRWSGSRWSAGGWFGVGWAGHDAAVPVASQ